MKNLLVPIIIGAFVGMGGCAQDQGDLGAEQAKVNIVVNQFNHVWETKDMATFSEIMAHDADMVVYGSDAPEHWTGWEPLKEAVSQMMPALENVKISVKSLTIKVHPTGQVAWFSEIWDWDFLMDGKSIHSPGQRLTGVLEKRNGEWVIVQIHNSVPVAV